MKKMMVQCEDGRRRQSRIHGEPREDGNFIIWQAGIRKDGKHVHGEAWFCPNTGTWTFLTDPEGKNADSLPRCKERPDEVKEKLIRSTRVRTA